MIYLFALLGYLIGSIPFGLVLTKLAGYGDIRAIGSGNIGATNVLRTGNKKLAALTLLLDGGKGAAAVLLAQFVMTYDVRLMVVSNAPLAHLVMIYDAGLMAAAGAFLGHLFPVWLKFKGGKGVATTLGILLALAPGLGVLCCLIWLAMATAFRYSSLAALVSIGLSPLLAYLFFITPSSYVEADGSQVWLVNHHTEYLPALCGFFAMMVYFKHRENIKRLVRGEEPKIGKKKEQ